jgi:hypothetical protein
MNTGMETRAGLRVRVLWVRVRVTTLYTRAKPVPVVVGRGFMYGHLRVEPNMSLTVAVPLLGLVVGGAVRLLLLLITVYITTSSLLTTSLRLKISSVASSQLAIHQQTKKRNRPFTGKG